MGKPTGFIELTRKGMKKRPASQRVLDWNEIYVEPLEEDIRAQASRCMDCGIPFCHRGCPLGNRIPEWNDLVYRGNWHEALERLHDTNNFPEFTGKLCPAPCEASCVLAIHDDAVTIKDVELRIIDWGFAQGLVKAQHATTRSGRNVAVIGSGPAGLACAQQLARAGHDVTVFEQSDRVGGLLRYGIPDFKMARSVLDRRLEQLREEGVQFQSKTQVGVDISGAEVLERFDAIALATGAGLPRGLLMRDWQANPFETRGVHLAMEYLENQNRLVASNGEHTNASLNAQDKRVVILGGGDTGADCLGTALRQGALEVLQFDLNPMPPSDPRDAAQAWPLWPTYLRVSPAHDEGGRRDFGIRTVSLHVDAGVLRGIEIERLQEDGSVLPERIDCELLLVATGFVGPQTNALYGELGVGIAAVPGKGEVVASDGKHRTANPKVFVGGDAQRGASLIVWAIAEGRRMAIAVDEFLRSDLSEDGLVTKVELSPFEAR